MALEKAPAFQFYPKDFLTDSNVVSMTLPERGAYITLLCLCWMDRSLPVELGALARLCRVSQAAFVRLWPALQPCFTVVDGRLIQGRIERERQKQETWRAMKVDAGQKGGLAKASNATKTGKQKASRRLAEASPPSSSSSSSSSAVSDLQAVPSELLKSRGVNSRSRRPIFSGQRFVVFDWMLEDIGRMLGPHLDAFDIHSWFFDLDARAATEGLVKAKADWWPWVQQELLLEAARRGLPSAAAAMISEQSQKNVEAGRRAVARIQGKTA